jgi:diguanylate cyclase (GGDEF)-like protein
MKFFSAKRISLTQPGSYSAVLAICWTAVIALSFYVNVAGMRQEITALSQSVARAYIDKDILYRNWNALHGGIYVEVSKALPPNKHYPLSVRERDITTPSGRLLTLVSPAYMMRQIYDFSSRGNNATGRITSLRPLRPENKPNVWEEAALHEFERGKAEVSEVVEEGEQRYLRLMRPLMTEESCLQCHAHQGYKKGDIRGGISIRMPMELMDASLRKQLEMVGFAHGTIWLLGLAGLYAGYTGLRRRTHERDMALAELKRLNVQLEGQATTDPLTGIWNRRKFSEQLHAEIQESNRYGMPLALIFFDVDHFKKVNDTYGHDTGDLVLKEISRVVSETIRHTDIFARFGGEEFVILVHNNDVRTGRDLAEKIRSVVSHHIFPLVGRVTCSVGVAQFYPDDSPEALIQRADTAMYAAKQGGRNRVATICSCEGGCKGRVEASPCAS